MTKGKPPCFYLGERIGNTIVDGKLETLHKCNHRWVGGECTQAICNACHQRTETPDDPESCVAGRTNQMKIWTCGQKDTHLTGMLRGGPAFIVASGLSINDIDRNMLYAPGVFKIGINNAAAHVHCEVQTFGDPVEKFHSGIWHDPHTMKMAPTAKLGQSVRQKVDGEFSFSNVKARECPGTFSIARNAQFRPGEYLWEESANWGCKKKFSRIGYGPHVLSTMFQAIKLAWTLGATDCYLLGVDFSMSNDQQYAFNEDKHAGGVASNNSAYHKIATMFEALRPHFDAAGFNVWNCNRRSKLTVFEHMPFDKAFDRATASVDGHDNDPARLTFRVGRPSGPSSFRAYKRLQRKEDHIGFRDYLRGGHAFVVGNERLRDYLDAGGFLGRGLFGIATEETAERARTRAVYGGSYAMAVKQAIWMGAKNLYLCGASLSKGDQEDITGWAMESGAVVYDCSIGYHRTQFAELDFRQAVERAKSRIGDEPLDTKGWYTKSKDKKKGK